jgi:hypothetical protein
VRYGKISRFCRAQNKYIHVNPREAQLRYNPRKTKIAVGRAFAYNLLNA